ncbi:hypothetical protein [Paraburkholderia sp. BR13444]|uniref:hypothetical protein n=1 Tax=Paraburkholderia sp. BR13444 TaxID=3236997 RepID=UPI0034CD881C
MSFVPPIVDTQVDQRNYNVPLYGIRGEFSLSPTVKVPYFTCLMDLNRVTAELKTHEEVNPSLDTIYSLEELFQRQIDIERVNREIVDGYLRLPNKLKFFNSLTIVLLPKDKDGKIVSQFENYENNDPPIPDPQFGAFDDFFAEGKAADRKAVFGGVQFVTTKTENLARLRWDKKRVDAVAVDGQHRLRALKLWMEGKNQQLSEIERPTRIPIIFLMLHKEAGFVGSANGGTSGIKGIAREIFTDLNKNAREVDLATQIILDDLSVESCCVRSLVTKTTCTDDDELLPLSLLRWQEANNRFDQKYYLNSLVNLHLLVRELIDLKTFNPMVKKEVLDFIKSVSRSLGTGEPRQLMHQGESLEDYYRRQYFDDDGDDPVAPFTGIPPNYLPAAVEGFSESFKPWLLSLLRRFAPYSKVIEYARNHNLIEGEFGQYLSQPRGHQEALAKDLQFNHGDHWKKLVIDDHSSAIEKIKGVGQDPLGEQWAFKTIFQKALVRLGQSLFVEAPEDDRTRFGDVNDYIYFLDRLYEADVLRVHAPLPGATHELWTFIAVNYGSRKIRVSGASEARILDLLRLWYFGWRFAKSTGQDLTISKTNGEGDSENESVVDAASILKHFCTKGSQLKWPGVFDSTEKLYGLFSPQNAASVIKGSEDLSDKECDRIARARLKQIFLEGLKPFAASNDAD